MRKLIKELKSLKKVLLMSDAIEVLKKFVKDCNECCVDDVPYRQPVEDAINKAILALEQKEKVDRFVVEVFNRLKERA